MSGDDWDDDCSDDDDYPIEPSDDDTTACPHCGRQVFDDSFQCPHCHTYLDADALTEPRSRWWRGIIQLTAIVVLLILVGPILLMLWIMVRGS